MCVCVCVCVCVGEETLFVVPGVWVTWIFCAFRAWSALDFRVFVDCQFTADATVVRRHPVHRVPYLEYCSFVPFVFWFIDKMISDFLFAVPLWGNLRVANWCVAAHQSSETRVADAVTVA